MAEVVPENGWDIGGDCGIDRWGEPVLPEPELEPQERVLEQRSGQAHGVFTGGVVHG